MSVEELAIIRSVQQGDVKSFSYLVNQYQNVVFSIALKVLKNREDAEEMAQEAFIKAFRSIHTFQGKSKFSTWMFSITYNTCITYARKKKIRTSPIEQVQVNEGEDDGNFGEFPEEARTRYLELALKQLSEEDYMLVVFHYYEDQTIEEISQVTGLSNANVKVKLFRARKKLYDLMQDLMKKEVYSEL